MSLYTELLNTCHKIPQATALIENETNYTYTNLIENINIIASCLKKYNVKSQDNVGLLCINQFEYVELLFGLNKIGAVAVPINPMQPPELIKFILENAQIKLLFITVEIYEKFKDAVPLVASMGIKIILIRSQMTDNPYIVSYNEFLQLPYEETETYNEPYSKAVLLYTSGTTGIPKGVPLTNENLLANVNSFCSVVELPKFSKSILSLPLFHSFGQIVLLVCILNHISTIMINHFLPTTILKAIVSHKAEVLPLVPTMFNVLITAAEKKDIDLNFIKFCITGGASIPITLLEKIKTITNARIIEGYGLTETSPVISISDSHYCYKKYSVGKPLPGVQVTIDEDGEIIVRGESVASRYWNNLEETKKSFTEDGYFRTGDIGKIDEDGFVFITDRKKDLIIRAGENISPKIIEDVLFQLQGINDAAVFGVYDEKLGEAIYCAVESEDHIDINYLRQVCKDKLPKHLVPEEFVIMPKLPRNALGKILKFKLRDMFAVAEKVKEPV